MKAGSVPIRVENVQIRRGRRMVAIDRASLGIMLALLPPVLISFLNPDFVVLLITLLATALFWSACPAMLQRRRIDLSLVPAALLLALLLPAQMPLIQGVLCFSFGIILGEQAFGGRGSAFLHPASASLAFLYLAFPVPENGPSLLAALAALPGIAMLLAAGLMPWRILAGLSAGLLAGLMFLPDQIGQLSLPVMILAGAFLVADPFSSAVTGAGRVIHGLAGGLLAMVGGGSAEAVLLSAFIVSILAPLTDGIVAAWHGWRRRSRNVQE